MRKSPALRWPSPIPRMLPMDRNDPYLALYLPLWYQADDMTGSTIYSYDRNHHTCTVTGAVYGTQGRTMDGDDKIVLTSPFSAGDAFTAIVWFKQITRADSRILEINITDGAGTQGMGFGISADPTNRLGVVYDGVAWGNQTTTPTLNTWYMATMTRVANVSNLYLNDGTGVISTLNAAPQDGGTGIHIGKGTDGTVAAYFFKGSIGDVLIYNRTVSYAEWVQIYQRTKWRYS